MYDYSTYQEHTLPGWAEARLSKTKELPVVFYLSQALIKEIHEKIPTPQSVWAERVLKAALHPRQAKKSLPVAEGRVWTIRQLMKDLCIQKSTLLVWLETFGWTKDKGERLRVFSDEQYQKLKRFQQVRRHSGLQYVRRIAQIHDRTVDDLLALAQEYDMTLHYVADLKELPALSFRDAQTIRTHYQNLKRLRLRNLSEPSHVSHDRSAKA